MGRRGRASGGGAGPSLSSASASRSKPKSACGDPLGCHRPTPWPQTGWPRITGVGRRQLPSLIGEEGLPELGPDPRRRGEEGGALKRSQRGTGRGDGEGAATSGGDPLAPRWARGRGGARLPASAGRVRGQQQARRSDGEGDEAVVALDAPLEDLGAGAQHALEAGPVQLHARQGPPGHHGGRPGPVQQQRDLPWGREGASGLRV